MDTTGIAHYPDGANGVHQQWLTADEAAVLLHVHVTTVHDMCRRGSLPALKTGRDWRISASGMLEQTVWNTARKALIAETAELAAVLIVARIREGMVEALSSK